MFLDFSAPTVSAERFPMLKRKRKSLVNFRRKATHLRQPHYCHLSVWSYLIYAQDYPGKYYLVKFQSDIDFSCSF